MLSGPDRSPMAQSGPDRAPIRDDRGPMAACAVTARPTSQANPAVRYDWWLGLVVCSRAAVWGPDRGPTALKQHLKQSRRRAVTGGLDWWFAPRPGRASIAASGADCASGTQALGNLWNLTSGLPHSPCSFAEPLEPKAPQVVLSLGGPIDTDICARILSAQKAPETFVGANDLALV